MSFLWIFRSIPDRTGLSLTRTITLFSLLLLPILGVFCAYQPQAGLLLAAGVPLVLGLIAWPEVTLVLYAGAGHYKAEPRLSSLNSLVDITLALGALLAATIAYRLVLRRDRFRWTREMSLALVFAAVILIGLVYTPATSYGTDKAFRFVSLTLLAFFTPIVIIRSWRSVWRFLLGWLAFTVFIAVTAMEQLGTGQRLTVHDASAIATSRTVGIAILILLFAVLLGRVSRMQWLVAAAGLVPLVLVLLGSGSRGPLLILLVTVALTTVVAFASRVPRTRSLMIVGILGVVVAGIFLSGLIPRASLVRFESLFNPTNTDASTQGRLQVALVAWQLFTTSPLVGHGTGSVSAFGAGQEQMYPHNVLLELAAETGLLGLVLFLGMVGLVLWRLLTELGKGSTKDSLWLAMLAILVYLMLNSLVSGDLNDGRIMWLFAGMAIAMSDLEEQAGVLAATTKRRD